MECSNTVAKRTWQAGEHAGNDTPTRRCLLAAHIGSCPPAIALQRAHAGGRSCLCVRHRKALLFVRATQKKSLLRAFNTKQAD